MRNHPVIGQDAIIAEDGALTRRDVSKTLSVEPDPNPAWMRTLPARLSPAVTDGNLLVVGTPLGARAFDADTGDAVWAYPDTG